MTTNVHLCPCCAAHLRVPVELHVMRCNSCDADLVWISNGGVRGLALIPTPETAPPYSDPAQWHRRANTRALDGRQLVDTRKQQALHALGVKRAIWAGLFWSCVVLFVGAIGCGLGGFAGLLRGGKHVEGPALAMLLAVMILPLLSYVALYFQGRVRLLADRMRRYQ